MRHWRTWGRIIRRYVYASIQTTADIYTDWDDEQLAETLLEVLDE